MKKLHWIYRGTGPGLVAGTFAAICAAIFLGQHAIYGGDVGAWVVLGLGFWGAFAVSQLWERCNRYEKLLRANGIDPLEAYTISMC